MNLVDGSSSTHLYLGNVCGRSWRPSSPEAVQEVRYEDYVVHSWYDTTLSPFWLSLSISILIPNWLAGHSLETFPEEMAAVRDAGHEM